MNESVHLVLGGTRLPIDFRLLAGADFQGAKNQGKKEKEKGAEAEVSPRRGLYEKVEGKEFPRGEE